MMAHATISAICAIFLTSHAGGFNSEDEKAEMQRSAEEFRKCAQENKSMKLDAGDENAPEVVKAAASKVVAAHQKLGAVEEQLAAAYEAGDKKRIQQLHKQKNDAELDCEFSAKEKMAAYMMSNVDELVQNMPNSAEAKQLKEKTVVEIKAYLENTKKMIELQKEQMRLEKGMESIDASIEIIRKREELKNLEEEAKQNS